MQLLTLLLVALGATSCASPVDTAEVDFNGTTSSTTEHHLEKRGTYGWISSYATMDFNCRGGYAGARPQIKGDCVNFTPVKGGGNIGINWGTWPDAFGSLNIYSHENCVNKITTVHGPAKHNRVGPQTCWRSFGKHVRSVRSSDSAKEASN